MTRILPPGLTICWAAVTRFNRLIKVKSSGYPAALVMTTSAPILSASSGRLAAETPHHGVWHGDQLSGECARDLTIFGKASSNIKSCVAIPASSEEVK